MEETILSRAPGLFPLSRIVSSIETPAFWFELFELRKQFKQQETIQQDETHKATIKSFGAHGGQRELSARQGGQEREPRMQVGNTEQ